MLVLIMNERTDSSVCTLISKSTAHLQQSNDRQLATEVMLKSRDDQFAQPSRCRIFDMLRKPSSSSVCEPEALHITHNITLHLNSAHFSYCSIRMHYSLTLMLLSIFVFIYRIDSFLYKKVLGKVPCAEDNSYPKMPLYQKLFGNKKKHLS